jgi:hypothetical protein
MTSPGRHGPRLTFFRQPFRRPIQAASVSAMRSGQHASAAPRPPVEGASCPVLLVKTRSGGDHLPDIDRARLGRAVGGMHDLARRSAVRPRALACPRRKTWSTAESTSVSSGRRAAAGSRLEPRLPSPRAPAEELRGLLGKPFRPGALERVDRLLLVADREDRAVTAARRVAGEEFVRQAGFDDRPLFRAGVLRLVDEDMVDALVELVVHPGPTSGPRQQMRRCG